MVRAIELFAGAGGLGIGVSRAGFLPSLIVERDRWCCDTLRENRTALADIWPEPVEGDIRTLDFKSHTGIDVVTGGPPCQPFSMGGKHRAQTDYRDMWSEAVRVVRETGPKAFIFENVRGLARDSFATYLSYILLQLEHPSVVLNAGEEWMAHLARLQRRHTSKGGAEYRVVHQIVDAADYGVAQRRHRILFVGFRADVDASWSFPRPTHSARALAWSQATGAYWDRHRVAKKDRTPSQPSCLQPLERLRIDPNRSNAKSSAFSALIGSLRDPISAENALELPWVTVRDALCGLPDPRSPGSSRWLDHKFQDGARSYPGHTGSPIDLPAKALKAGVHGVPGGENMMRLPDGSIRYFTVREAARLQAFPDHWRFHGSWSETMRQLGNAVPTTLGEVVARSVRRHLETVP